MVVRRSMSDIDVGPFKPGGKARCLNDNHGNARAWVDIHRKEETFGSEDELNARIEKEIATLARTSQLLHAAPGSWSSDVNGLQFDQRFERMGKLWDDLHSDAERRRIHQQLRPRRDGRRLVSL